MISTQQEYEGTLKQVEHLQEWLARCLAEHPNGESGHTTSGIRKLLARYHEELAVYEAELEHRIKAEAIKNRLNKQASIA
jgi:hypothetical protein